MLYVQYRIPMRGNDTDAQHPTPPDMWFSRLYFGFILRNIHIRFSRSQHISISICEDLPVAKMHWSLSFWCIRYLLFKALTRISLYLGDIPAGCAYNFLKDTSV